VVSAVWGFRWWKGDNSIHLWQRGKLKIISLYKRGAFGYFLSMSLSANINGVIAGKMPRVSDKGIMTGFSDWIVVCFRDFKDKRIQKNLVGRAKCPALWSMACCRS
jgi:hypothetical protein